MSTSILVTRKQAIVIGIAKAAKLTDCTAAQQYTRLCDLVGTAIGSPFVDQKVRVFVTKLQENYNRQLASRERTRVWEAGRVVVKAHAAKKFSPFTWNLPRSRAFNAVTPQGEPASVSQPTKKVNPMSKKAPKPPAKKDAKNGITMPKEGTVCRKIFDMADRFDGVRAKVLAECEKRKINQSTATTQYGKWRVYHGLKGRKAKAVKKAPPKAPKKKSPPKAPVAAVAAPATV